MTARGDANATIEGFASFDEATPGDLTFAIDDKRLGRIGECQAAAIIVPADAEVDTSTTLIRIQQIEAAIAELLARFAPPEDLPPAGVHASAVIDSSANVAPDAAIGPHVVVGADSTVGAGSVLAANVVVGRGVTIGAECVVLPGAFIASECEIGDRVRIGPNSTVGQDGFGYVTIDGVHRRIEHIGNVIIEDDAELGACTCVDRAKFGSTRIGRGAKIDNLVQIAHNVQVGAGSLIASQVGVAGSTKLGQYVVLGGHTGVRDNITIGDGVQVAAYAAVANHVEAGEKMGGIPARPAGLFRRIKAGEAKLPELVKRVKALEKKLESSE
ncbi:MAG: UDP-3-O-(3-hydroxymyristoyl)glucosamine N-acyltransferase [Planctomycetota bacterium]